MKYIITILLFIISCHLYAQHDTALFIGTNGRLTSELNAKKKITIEVKSKKKFIETTYIKGQSGWEVSKNEVLKKIDDGTYSIVSGGLKKNTLIRNYVQLEENLYKFTEVKEDRIIRTGYSRTIAPIVLQGEIKEFYMNGNKSSESVYENNELVSNKNWLEDGTEYYKNVFYSVDVTPFYIPGNNRLHEHILKTLKENEIDFTRLTGNMVVGFVISEDGTIGGFKIMKGIQSDVNKVVITALQSLNGEWQPARLNEEFVNYFQLLPINFIHNTTQYDHLEMEGGVLQWSSN